MANCRSCGAAIIWGVVEGSDPPKPMPIDAEPRADGNVLIVRGNVVRVLGKMAAAEMDRRGEVEGRHVSHFATCPNAQRHRRRA